LPARLITPPDDEPVSLDEAKTQLRLEVADDDTFVTSLISAARMFAEEHCWRGFVTQTWELVLPCFPSDSCLPVDRQGIELPMGNLVEVGSVKYIDVNGVEQTLDPSEYSVDDVNVPGRLRLAYGKFWPSPRSQWDAVRIEYDVGWSVDEVPAPVKQALLLHLSQMYENRTPDVAAIPAVESLLRPYRLVRF
jgi:uncharacterized phiE125 gp8 family phage protein